MMELREIDSNFYPRRPSVMLEKMTKDEITEILGEIAIFLELKGENPFKSRAYVNAARILESYSEPIEIVFAAGSEIRLKGIGDKLHEKITEMVATGQLEYHANLKASIPPGLVEMLNIPGLGPKKIKALYDKLGLTTVADLDAACREEKISGLAGFGEKTQANILQGIQFRQQYASRHLLGESILAAEPILDSLRQHSDVVRCSTAGSLRRCKEIIGDIDFLASSRQPAVVIDFFASQPGIITVLAKGETKASVIVAGGIQADLRVVSDVEYPFCPSLFHREQGTQYRHAPARHSTRFAAQ